MSRAADRLRAAIEEFSRAHAIAALDRFRSGEPGAPELGPVARLLFSREAPEALEEALGSGALGALEAAWLRRQVERAEYARSVAEAEAALDLVLARASLASGEPLHLRMRLARIAAADDGQRRALEARAIEAVLLPLARERMQRQLRAEDALLAAGAPPARPAGSRLIVSAFSVEALAGPSRTLPDAAWHAEARAFLAATEAAAEDAVRFALRAHKPGKQIDLHLLLRGLRAPELDSARGREQRWRRVSAWLLGLGFERELQARVRAEPHRAAVLPFAAVVALDVPRDVRVAQSGTDYGVMSDVLAAGGLGRALGLALIHPALPPEQRIPLDAGVAGAIGVLGQQVWADRQQLVRLQAMSAPEAERVSRLAGTVALLVTRATFAVALVQAQAADAAESRIEALASELGRALRCEVPPGAAGLLGADRVAARARAEEALAGLALYAGLRERFDADWYRDPRNAELLRAGCARGNGLAPSALCEELGIPLSAAVGRGLELVT